MLRHESPGINDLPVYVVAKLLFERLPDDTEGVATIMGNKILHVLQKKGSRTLLGDDPRDVEEKSPLGGAFETMGPPERVLLRHAGNAERLAWKAR